MQTTELQKEDTEMKKFLEGFLEIFITIVLWIVMTGTVVLGLVSNQVQLDFGWYILIGIACLMVSQAIISGCNTEG